MVMSMVGCPPDRPLLSRGCTKKRKDKLKCSTGLVRAMREIPVIPSGDCEHPYDIEEETDGYGRPAHPHPEGKNTGEMNYPKHTLLEYIHYAWAIARINISKIHNHCSRIESLCYTGSLSLKVYRGGSGVANNRHTDRKQDKTAKCPPLETAEVPAII